MFNSSSDDDRPRVSPTRVVVAVVIALVLVVVALFGFVAITKSFNRYQKRADAHNQVKVTAIQIQNQAQRVQIAKQKATIRFENSVGVRKAQDEIAKTLTDKYIQFEMIEALKAVASSGSNNSVIFIPTGSMGVPLTGVLDAIKPANNG